LPLPSTFWFAMDSATLRRPVFVCRGKDSVLEALAAAKGQDPPPLVFEESEVERLFALGFTRPAQVRAVAAAKAEFGGWVAGHPHLLRAARLLSLEHDLPGLVPEDPPEGGSAEGEGAGGGAAALSPRTPPEAAEVGAAAWRAAAERVERALAGRTDDPWIDLAEEAAIEAESRAAARAGNVAGVAAAAEAWERAWQEALAAKGG